MASAPDKGKEVKKDAPANAAPAAAGAAAPPPKKRRRNIEEERRQMGFIRTFIRDSPAFALSAVVHMFIVLLLALVTLAPEVAEVINEITATGGTEGDAESDVIEEMNMDLPSDVPEVQQDMTSTQALETGPVNESFDQVANVFDESAAAVSVPEGIGMNVPSASVLINTAGKAGGTGISGRGRASRQVLVAAGGGTPGSEESVGHGLKWLAAHQIGAPDNRGGWSFNHGFAGHEGPVNNPGNRKSTTGATALAVLPFLGAGQTHMEGEYKDVVRGGLYHLGAQMKVTPNGGDLRGGNDMYDHGLATIALCEAYALTHDKGLMVHAQQAINFIAYAQDPTAGGWRYAPHQPGDTSVVGWQVMALKSGHLAYLQVDKKTIAGAINFLNTAQAEGGAYYGYTGPGQSPATTAVGLLCRQYMGWKKDEPALIKGVDYLSKMGPSKTNMYFNYYATQVLHHMEGESWTKWNSVMREQLVSTQVKTGSYKADRGSWTPAAGNHSEVGGRLTETSLCTMTLEIYYRYMPLYQNQANEDEF